MNGLICHYKGIQIFKVSSVYEEWGVCEIKTVDMGPTGNIIKDFIGRRRNRGQRE